MDRKQHYFRLLASASVLLAITAPAFGQASGNAPSREEIRRETPALSSEANSRHVAVDAQMDRGPCPLSELAYAGKTFTVSGVEFANLGDIPPDMLRPAYASHLGKTVPLATLCDIRDAADELLRRKGYLATVDVRPQSLDGGIVRFNVVVARIVGFQVKGNAGKAEKRIAGLLEQLRAQPQFNVYSAERTLLLLRDMPGYDIRLALRPAGTGPGDMIGEVLINFEPVQAELSANNYSAKVTGRIGALAQFHVNGLFGTGDRTTMGVFSTSDLKEQIVLFAGEELQLGTDGLSLGADVAYAWTRPDFGVGSDFVYTTFVAGLHARYPLVRQQVRTIAVSGGLDWIEQRGKASSFEFFRDKLRIAYVRIDFDRIHAGSIASTKGYSAAEPRWKVGGSLELRQGLSILGATKSCGPGFVRCFNPGVVPPSFLNADMTPSIARASANVEFRPSPEFTLSFSPRAQLSPRALPAYEEFAAGAFTIGRGYDPSALSGDIAVGFASEARLGSLVPASQGGIAWQGFSFLDSAWLWDNFGGSTGNRQHLTSTGGGVRAVFGKRFRLETTLGVPLSRLSAFGGRGNVRVLVNLTMNILPWKNQ